MSSVWIKICGITRQQDALAAAALGVNAIGLVIYAHSPRAVPVEDIATIAAAVSGRIKVVALFVNPDAVQVSAAVETGLVDYLQFHGEESATFCESFGLPYLKALRVGDPGRQRNLEESVEVYRSAEMILLDSFDRKAPGGTGRTFDWSQAESVAGRKDVKIVIAGGLTVENVTRAVRQLHPFGVDVSGGVEAGHGIKDLQKMKLFIEGSRSV